MLNFRRMLWVPCFLLPALGSAQIVTLSGVTSVDDQFTTFLSTSATSLGSDPAFMSGNNWGTTNTGSIGIFAPGTYFIHVRAIDNAPPGMFIGQFSLSSSSGMFVSTGTQSIFSLSSTFSASTGANPGATSQPINDLGPNGTGPWGSFALINSGAHFLWAGSPPITPGIPLFFTTQINVVPEPATLIALSVGAATLLGKRRRR